MKKGSVWWGNRNLTVDYAHFEVMLSRGRARRMPKNIPEGRYSCWLPQVEISTRKREFYGEYYLSLTEYQHLERSSGSTLSIHITICNKRRGSFPRYLLKMTIIN